MNQLYVMEAGSVVRLSGDCFLVESRCQTNGRTEAEQGSSPPTLRVALQRLEGLTLLGRVHVTAEALDACFEQGLSLSFLTRSGRLRARLSPALDRAADLRLMQFEAFHDPGNRLARARLLVAGKGRNAMAVLGDLRRNHRGEPAFANALAGIRSHIRGARRAGDRDALLGWEGQIARAYFGALRAAFRGPIAFDGRRQRPAPDPANALLSFGYVLLGNLVAGMVEARGLDPGLGCFHEVHPGRPSLALDLIEELRHPVVDRFVMRVCNLQILQPRHFEPDPEREGGVRLTREGLKIFFTQWETFLRRPLRGAETRAQVDELPPRRLDVRGLIRRQVDRLAADLRGGPSYRPFEFASAPSREDLA